MPDGGNKTAIPSWMMSGAGSAQFGFGGLFSPGLPPVPTDKQQVRAWDFSPAQNLQWTPRSIEPFGFPSLRSFSNVELVRLAIETRKDQIEGLDWNVTVRGDRRKRVDAVERIRSVERFMRKPDGVTPFASWMRLLMEDVLAIDAPSVERRWNGSGDTLAALEVVDGATIKLLIDDAGRTPVTPAPAYQQVIKGRIWADLTTEDLIYMPRNRRPGHLYGFGPVEQTVVTINTAIRRQGQQLAYFTESTIPRGMVNVPEGWTIDQVKDFQDWMDARLSGNLAERSKLLWAPSGSEYQAFKESPIKDEFDEWLARVICFAFSIPPTAFVKQLNRSTAEESGSRATMEGLEPLKRWCKRFWDGVIQDDLGYPDLEFKWLEQVEIDPKAQAEIDERHIRIGLRTIDEVRASSLGLDPYKGGIGEKPLVYTAKGVIPLDQAILPRPEDESAEAGDDEGNADGDEKPEKGAANNGKK